MLMWPGPHGRGALALVLALAVACAALLPGRAEAQTQLTLSDFNRAGLDIEILILIETTEGSGDVLWGRGRFATGGDIGTLLDGGTNGVIPMISLPLQSNDPSLTDGNLIRLRRQGSGSGMTLNDDGALDLRSYFGAPVRAPTCGSTSRPRTGSPTRTSPGRWGTLAVATRPFRWTPTRRPSWRA